MKNTSLNISIETVTKKYDEFYALKDISLDITSGEFMTLLGPSGSGKTTLLMVLAGFTNPDYGSVKFGEEEVVLTPPHLRGIGMVFQNYALFPHMTVEQNVGYPQKLIFFPLIFSLKLFKSFLELKNKKLRFFFLFLIIKLFFFVEKILVVCGYEIIIESVILLLNCFIQGLLLRVLALQSIL